jgi:hypothetical protein
MSLSFQDSWKDSIEHKEIIILPLEYAELQKNYGELSPNNVHISFSIIETYGEFSLQFAPPNTLIWLTEARINLVNLLYKTFK